MRRAAAVSLLCLLSLTASGCSGSGAPVAGPTPPVVLPTASPTPSATPSTTAVPTAGLTPSATTKASATPRVRPADGDIDGDGVRDAVRATAELLTVELSSGRTVTSPVHADSPRSPAVLGYADVDGDGRAEVFLQTAEGASTQFATPYRYDGTSLRELQLDGAPARLGMGGSVTHGDGFRCRGDRLDVLASDSSDGKTYVVHVDTYRIRGPELVLVVSRTTKAQRSDALVEASYRPDCGSVTG